MPSIYTPDEGVPIKVSIRVGQSAAQDARRDHAGLRTATCQVCCVRRCTNRRKGTATKMRVERVVVALLLPVSQGAGLDVIDRPGERPKKGSERNPCWVASSWPRKSYGQETKSSNRKRKHHAIVEHGRAWGSQVERVTATPARRESKWRWRRRWRCR